MKNLKPDPAQISAHHLYAPLAQVARDRFAEWDTVTPEKTYASFLAYSPRQDDPSLEALITAQAQGLNPEQATEIINAAPLLLKGFHQTSQYAQEKILGDTPQEMVRVWLKESLEQWFIDRRRYT